MASITARAKRLNAWRRRALNRGAQLEFQSPLPLREPAAVQPWDEATLDPQAIARPPLAIRPGRPVELGRGAQLEFQSPLPIRGAATPSFGDGAGAASGDSTVSGELDAFADFAGAASGDATVAGTLDALADFAGAASGDSTASGALDALADFAGAASGDATADGAITGRYDYPLSATFHLLTQQGARRRQRPIIEKFQPLPIAIINRLDGDGSAIGDSAVSGALDALADFAGAASGDATASGALDAFGDFAGAASGDATVSGALDALADFDGAASGDSTASGEITGRYDYPLSATCHLLTQQATRQKQRPIIESVRPLPIVAFIAPVDGDGAGSADGDSTATGGLDALADFAGTATGDSTASGGLDAFADMAGSAIGDATASGGLDAFADAAGSATGDATCEGFIEDATPAVVTPPVVADAGGTGGQVFRGAWTDRIRKPKRKKRLDDLDEMIAELRSRIEEVPVEATAEDIYQRTLRVSQALANQPDPSLRAIDNQLVLLRAAIQEIDDEEAILLLAA
jgi:hypothetical protein